MSDVAALRQAARAAWEATTELRHSGWVESSTLRYIRCEGTTRAGRRCRRTAVVVQLRQRSIRRAFCRDHAPAVVTPWGEYDRAWSALTRAEQFAVAKAEAATIA